jgi:hypothetical protein
MTATAERKPAEQLLEEILYICFDALDPILTREQVIQKIRDIYDLAAPDDDDGGADSDN